MAPAEELADHELITAWGHVVEAYALVTREMRADLASSTGWPETWFEVLLRLSRSPDGRLPMTVLAEQVSFSSGGFTKLADRLVEAGLVERHPCPSDRRVTWIGLSDEGRRAIAEASSNHVRLLRDQLVDALGTSGVRQLTSKRSGVRARHRSSQSAVAALMRCAIAWATSAASGVKPVGCSAISFVRSPCTRILPVMNACMAAEGFWSTNSALVVA